MKQGYRVIDADRHVMEPADLWDRYMDAKFRGRVAVSSPDRAGRLIDGKPTGTNTEKQDYFFRLFARDPQYVKVLADTVEHNFDVGANLRAMDSEGVDIAVHFPSLGLYIPWRDDVEADLAAAICHGYNTWLAEFCSADPARLKGIAMIPLHDTDLAIKELRRAKEELGFVGILWRPNPLKGRNFDHPDYLPIYEAAGDLGMPVCVHEGTLSVLPTVAETRFSDFGRHIVCHPFEQMLSLLTFCADGVLERYPRLKVAFLESGCGWLPFWLDRMDEHWENAYLGLPVRTTSQKPSMYFKRQCVVGCEGEDEFAASVQEHVGNDNLVMASDYPHIDVVGKWPEEIVGGMTGNPALTDETKRKILWDNPARFYGLGDVMANRDSRAAATPVGVA